MPVCIQYTLMRAKSTEIADSGAGAQLADRVRDIADEEAGLGHRLQLGRRLHTRILVSTSDLRNLV